MIDTSELPLSVYDGSLTSNIILLILYLRLILYYVVLAAGIVLIICLILSPFIISYYGIKTLKIQVKNNKKKISHKHDKQIKEDKTIGYLSRLEKIS